MLTSVESWALRFCAQAADGTRIGSELDLQFKGKSFVITVGSHSRSGPPLPFGVAPRRPAGLVPAAADRDPTGLEECASEDAAYAPCAGAHGDDFG